MAFVHERPVLGGKSLAINGTSFLLAAGSGITPMLRYIDDLCLETR